MGLCLYIIDLARGMKPCLIKLLLRGEVNMSRGGVQHAGGVSRVFRMQRRRLEGVCREVA